MQQGSIKYVGRQNQRKQKYVDYPSTLGESNEVIELTGGGTQCSGGLDLKKKSYIMYIIYFLLV